jgi:membrane protein YqaA with SNARE-associated domain
VKLILGTFFFSIASALIPVLNLEVYLSAIPDGHHSALLVACAAGAGQTVGKVIWYFAGMHSMKVAWLRKKMETEKWQLAYAKWHERIVGRPVLAGAISFGSAVSGFPPIAIIAVLAGSLRMNLALFISTVLVGRVIRFWLVLEGAGFVKHLAEHLVNTH